MGNCWSSHEVETIRTTIFVHFSSVVAQQLVKNYGKSLGTMIAGVINSYFAPQHHLTHLRFLLVNCQSMIKHVYQDMTNGGDKIGSTVKVFSPVSVAKRPVRLKQKLLWGTYNNRICMHTINDDNDKRKNAFNVTRHSLRQSLLKHDDHRDSVESDRDILSVWKKHANTLLNVNVHIFERNILELYDFHDNWIQNYYKYSNYFHDDKFDDGSKDISNKYNYYRYGNNDDTIKINLHDFELYFEKQLRSVFDEIKILDKQSFIYNQISIIIDLLNKLVYNYLEPNSDNHDNNLNQTFLISTLNYSQKGFQHCPKRHTLIKTDQAGDFECDRCGYLSFGR